MSTLADRTARKYRGKMASGYEAKRRRQERWALENETVERMMRDARGSVLDAPCGTGRFLRLWDKLGLPAIGLDASEEMLRLARQKRSAAQLHQGDLRDLKNILPVDNAVCVRLLDLIDEEAMRAVMRELARVTKRMIVLTIRLGVKYAEKSNTCEHSTKQFRALVRSLGFEIVDVVRFRHGGWHIMRLERRR